MSEIHIRRIHALGLPKARQLARQWVADGARRYDLVCTVTEGATQDTVQFRRSGVTGRLVVTATQLDLSAQLGFLLSGFHRSIEAQIQKNIDGLLARR